MRVFTTPQLALLQSPNIRGRMLTTWHLTGGPFYFCDDVEDLTDGTNTYVGASVLAVCSDINSSNPFAAEPVTFTLDGNRMLQTGFTDPAALFRSILGMDLHNRRVDIALGLSYPDVQTITLVIPVYAGRINNAKVVYPKVEFNVDEIKKPQPGNLVFTFDSLASRYSRISGRMRSQVDQLEIDPTDNFFKFAILHTVDQQLYWGSSTPKPNLTSSLQLQYNNYITVLRRGRSTNP